MIGSWPAKQPIQRLNPAKSRERRVVKIDLQLSQPFYERLRFEKVYQFRPRGDPGYVSMQRGEESVGIGAGAGEPF